MNKNSCYQNLQYHFKIILAESPNKLNKLIWAPHLHFLYVSKATSDEI